MNRDEALKRSDAALEELIQQLQQGKSESLVKYLETLSRLHRYSFGNLILIACQKPDATLVAGFHRWKELGRFVKKGELGIAILAPMVSRKKSKAESSSDAEPNEPQDPKSKVLYGFRVVHVFDVSQTDGKELPKLASIEGDVGDKIEALETIVRAKGIDLIYEEIPGGALGVSEGGRIRVVPALREPETFAVLVHELAHELLHRGDRRKDTTKTVRETEAEAVAFVVCRAAGLDCSTRSSDYLQLYGGDKDLLLQSLELIRNVSSSIISELETAVLSEKEVADAA